MESDCCVAKGAEAKIKNENGSKDWCEFQGSNTMWKT